MIDASENAEGPNLLKSFSKAFAVAQVDWHGNHSDSSADLFRCFHNLRPVCFKTFCIPSTQHDTDEVLLPEGFRHRNANAGSLETVSMVTLGESALL